MGRAAEVVVLAAATPHPLAVPGLTRDPAASSLPTMKRGPDQFFIGRLERQNY